MSVIPQPLTPLDAFARLVTFVVTPAQAVLPSGPAALSADTVFLLAPIGMAAFPT